MHLNPARTPPHGHHVSVEGSWLRFKGFGQKKKSRICACGTGDMNWLQEITKLLRQQSASGQAFRAVGGVGMKHI